MRLAYETINPTALTTLLSLKKQTASIPKDVRALLELRISQINGCSYCIDLHAKEAVAHGVDQQRINCLSVAAESGLFTPKEIAALSLAEQMTRIAEVSGIETQRDALKAHFTEEEIVDLIYIIAAMNAMNRIAITCGDQPPKA